MVVSEILNDARDIFGQCEGTLLYDRITEGVELLANESPSWDAMTDGVCTFNVGKTATGTEVEAQDDGFEEGIIVLPPFIETPLGINLDGYPTFPRDRWFQFHINGPGNRSFNSSWRDFWDDRGNTPVLAQHPELENLVLTTDDVRDNAAQITIFGTDANDVEIYTNGQRGFSFDVGTTSPVPVKKILEVSKPQSFGTWTLKSQTSDLLLGSYAPAETCPSYRKIKVPARVTATIRYRRSSVKVEKATDVIPLNSKLAVKLAMQAANFYNTRRYDEAKTALAEAVSIANKEQQSRNAQAFVAPQVMDLTERGGESLWRGGRRGGCCGSGGYGST